jgi:predicted transcriptional regulator
MSENEQIIKDYFTGHFDLFSIKSIEKKAGIPTKTLAHFLKGRRRLNENHCVKILNVINNLEL